MQMWSHCENQAITKPIMCVNAQLFQLCSNIQSARAFIERMCHSWETNRRWALGKERVLKRWVPLSPAPVTLLSHAVEQLSLMCAWLRSAGEDWSLRSSCWLTAGTERGLISHYDNQSLLSAQRSVGSLLFVFAIHICVWIQSPVMAHHLWLLQ